MSLRTEEKHFPILIGICFVSNFILGAIGQVMAQNSFGQKFLWQVGGLFFIAGTSLYAAKLHTEKWHISSAGFILLSIGQGISFAEPDPTNIESLASAFMVFLPGMFFIAYYSGFPKWLRLLGLLAVVPVLVAIVKIDSSNFNPSSDYIYVVISYILIQLVSFGWVYYIFRPYKNIRYQEEV